VTSVPGCVGVVSGATDYCAYRPTATSFFLRGNNGSPLANFPLGLCEGDCDSDSECEGSLVCQYRSGDEAVLGCEGHAASGEDYCHDPNPGPVSSPTYAPNSFGATYVPGDLSVPCDNGKVMLSKGMGCKLLTTAGVKVALKGGGLSVDVMHQKADGAGVIPHPTDGGWYYVSNSEVDASLGGGVGSLRFDAAEDVIGYERNLWGTTRNRGGGKTW